MLRKGFRGTKAPYLLPNDSKCLGDATAAPRVLVQPAVHRDFALTYDHVSAQTVEYFQDKSTGVQMSSLLTPMKWLIFPKILYLKVSE